MKKTLALILALCMVCACLCACGDDSQPDADDSLQANGDIQQGGDTQQGNDTQQGGDGQQGDQSGSQDSQSGSQGDTPPADTTPKEEPMREFDTPEQKALWVVAEAYLARKTYLQYDDSNLVNGSTAGVVYRTDRHVYSPEDATRQFTTYSNCAAWTYDLYYETFGIDIVAWNTGMLQRDTEMHAFTYNVKKTETQEEKDRIIKEFFDILQPGDLINYRYADESIGHVMLYIGGDDIIHCTRGVGGNYDYAQNKELYEPSGAIQRLKTDYLFSTSGYDLFSQESFSIVRPLMKFTDAQITQKTQSRVENLYNIYIEKLSSHPAGFTAQQGEEVTYTYFIRNNRVNEATVEIVDYVPENSTYVSGGDSVNGTEIKWSVTVPSGGSTEVSYTVRVNSDAKDGDYLFTTGYAGGVDVECRKVYIGGNLSADVRAKITTEASKAATMGAGGLALAEKIYAAAGYTVDLPSEADLMNSLFTKLGPTGNHVRLNTSSEYLSIVAPTMYGGWYCATSDVFSGWRTKGVLASQLMEGDIIVCCENGKYTTYMYAGGNKALALDGTKIEVLDLIKTRDALISAIGYDCFAVIRPAMAD